MFLDVLKYLDDGTKNKEIFEILTKEINEENIIKDYFDKYIEVEEGDAYQGNPAIINLFLEKDYIRNDIENIKKVIYLYSDGLNLETFEYLFKNEELFNDKECIKTIFGYYCENGKLDEIKSCIEKIKEENEREEIIKDGFIEACDNKKFEVAQFLLNEYDFVKNQLDDLILPIFRKSDFNLETVNFLIKNGGKFKTIKAVELSNGIFLNLKNNLKKLCEGYSDKIKNKLNEAIGELDKITPDKDGKYNLSIENLKKLNELLDGVRKEMAEKKAKGKEVDGSLGSDGGELVGDLEKDDVKKTPAVLADNNSENEENNNKYLIPKDSNTIKKLKMFNDDIYIPEGEVKEEKIQKVSNRLNKDKRLYDEKKEKYTIKGGNEKDIKTFKAKKKYNDNDVEKYNKKERKEKSYLEYEYKTTNNSGHLKNLFASRFFNYMGYPTFNAYLLLNNNKPLFEEIKGSAVGSVSTFYKDENITKQFIKRNIAVVFFGDTDAHLENIMYNSTTKEVKLIDLNIMEPVGRFNVNEIFLGRDSTIYNYYILDMSGNNKDIINSCKNSKLLKKRGIADIINDNHVNIVKNEYFNLQKKLFLINNEDLDFITLSNNKELNKDDDFPKEVNKFKSNIRLHKVKSFYWMYTQNNLYQLFNLSKKYEEKLHNLFNIDKFLKDNTIDDVADCDEYTKFLNSLSETPEFKNFMTLANSFSKKNEKENYQNPNELFSNNKLSLEKAINSSENFDEFIEKFNLDLGINEKSNKKEETPSATDTEIKPESNVESKPETPPTAEPSEPETPPTEPTTNPNPKPKSEDSENNNLEEEGEPEIELKEEEDEPEIRPKEEEDEPETTITQKQPQTRQAVTPEQQQKQNLLKTRVEHYEKKVENLQNSNKTIKSAQKSSKSNSEPIIDNITSKIKEEGRKSDKEFDKIAKEAEVTAGELLANEEFKEATLVDVEIKNEDGTSKNYEKGFGGTVAYCNDDGKVKISFKEDGFLMEQLGRMNLGAEYNDVIDILKKGIVIENAEDEELKNFFIKIKTNPAKAYIELCKNKNITVSVDNDINDKIKGAFAIVTDTRKALDCINYVSKRLDSIKDDNYKQFANILIEESMNIIKTGEVSGELRGNIVTNGNNKDMISILKHSTELLYAIENQNKDLNEINDATEKKDIEEQRAKLAEICKNPSLESFAKFLNEEKLKNLRKANKILNRIERKEIIVTL